MRIIGGQFRGLKLAEVGRGDAAAHLRPTSDRVRESMFNLLQNGGYGDPLNGARVLDLFAGTGALGLEALSRGADHATFVDSGRVALGLVRRNIDLCHAVDKTSIISRDVLRIGSCSDAACNLVFLDPPYDKGLGEKALVAALAGGWIAPGGLVVWEEAREVTAPKGVTKLDCRRYGDTFVTLLSVETAA